MQHGLPLLLFDMTNERRLPSTENSAHPEGRKLPLFDQVVDSSAVPWACVPEEEFANFGGPAEQIIRKGRRIAGHGFSSGGSRDAPRALCQLAYALHPCTAGSGGSSFPK